VLVSFRITIASSKMSVAVFRLPVIFLTKTQRRPATMFFKIPVKIRIGFKTQVSIAH
jgi:hypothetical protein